MSYALVYVNASQADTAAVLERLGRTADTLEHGGFTLVRDHAIARQSALESLYSGHETDLERLARDLSGTLGTAAFAVLNFDNDVLAFFAYDKGVRVSQYNSSPDYLACAPTPPEAENVEGLAALFGRPEAARGIAALLGRRRGLGFLNEAQRHAQLEDLLGLPRSSEVGLTSSAV